MDAPTTTPELTGQLQKNLVRLPEAIEKCSGIRVSGKLLRSFVFSTDVALIRNCNADAVIAVYPFTPHPVIAQAVILAANRPVFCGIGGGITNGQRSVELAKDAEFQGAAGVVLNHPSPHALIATIKKQVDIPVAVTVVSPKDDIAGRIKSGADILNVAAGSDTPAVVRHIRSINAEIPVLATGGCAAASIQDTIAAGAHAITFTPPSCAELFRAIMDDYRGAPRKHERFKTSWFSILAARFRR